jgi:hypothetical protein
VSGFGRVAQGVAPPGLPQIRTCGFPASGSWRRRLAASCDAPGLLPVAVALTGCRGPESPPVCRPRFDEALAPWLTRVLAGPVPLARRSDGPLRLLSAPPAPLMRFAWAVPLRCIRTFAPTGTDACRGPGTIGIGRPAEAERSSRDGQVSQVPGEP